MTIPDGAAAAVALLFTLHALAAFGLWLIVGTSRISEPFRAVLSRRGRIGALLVELLECPLCFGFWVGFFAGLAALLACGQLSVATTWTLKGILYTAALPAAGCFTAATTYTLDALTGADKEHP